MAGVRAKVRTLLAASAIAMLAAACGGSSQQADPGGAGDIPDSQVFVDFTPPTGVYSVRVPEGWARSDDAAGVTFSDKFNSVRLETTTAPSMPTVDSARANEVAGMTAAQRNVQIGTVTQVTRQAGPAIRITYRADSVNDPVTGKVIRLDAERYEFFRNGVEVVVTLSGPQGSDNVDPWNTVTDSFRWL